MGIHAIIPAGGAGTRLWPISQASRPKFLLDLAGTGQSLLEDTVQRLSGQLASLTVVTGLSHARAVGEKNLARFCSPGAFSILCEPSPRDSLPAIAWACAKIHRKYGNVLAGSFAADQVISNQPHFSKVLAQALQVAESGKIVTLGISPTSPSTAYGYIQTQGEPMRAVKNPAFSREIPAWSVQSFKEKPDHHLAQQYLEQGGFFWNAGIFVFQTGVFLEHLRKLHPAFFSHLESVLAGTEQTTLGQTKLPAKNPAPAPSEQLWAAPKGPWEKLNKISIDHAIAEPAAKQGAVAVVEAANLGWSDLGDYDALAALHLRNAEQNGSSVALGSNRGEVEFIDSPGAFVFHQGKEPLYLLGVPQAVVVRLDGATLVTTREHAQRVKTLSRNDIR